MDSTSRAQVIRSLRAAAKVLAATPVPAGLRAFMKSLAAEYLDTKFTVKSFDRQGETSYSLDASTFSQGSVLRMTTWSQQDGSMLVDVSMIGDRGMVDVLRGDKALPSAAVLKKLWKKVQAQHPVVIGQKPSTLPADPKVTKVTVKPYTLDEWVGLSISVEGDWNRTGRSVGLSSEEDAFAQKVFQKALPEIQKQAAKWKGKTAKVWPDGSGPGGDDDGYGYDDESNLVEKPYPQVRSFHDVGQIDFEGDKIVFDVSDR